MLCQGQRWHRALGLSSSGEMTPINQMHKTLQTLSTEDPTLQRPIEFIHGAIRLQTYERVKSDPGVQAWFREHWDMLREISVKRREAYSG